MSIQIHATFFCMTSMFPLTNFSLHVLMILEWLFRMVLVPSHHFQLRLWKDKVQIEVLENKLLKLFRFNTFTSYYIHEVGKVFHEKTQAAASKMTIINSGRPFRRPSWCWLRRRVLAPSSWMRKSSTSSLLLPSTNKPRSGYRPLSGSSTSLGSCLQTLKISLFQNRQYLKDWEDWFSTVLN